MAPLRFGSSRRTPSVPLAASMTGSTIGNRDLVAPPIAASAPPPPAAALHFAVHARRQDRLDVQRIDLGELHDRVLK